MSDIAIAMVYIALLNMNSTNKLLALHFVLSHVNAISNKLKSPTSDKVIFDSHKSFRQDCMENHTVGHVSPQ